MGWTKVETDKPHRCDKPYFFNEGITVGDTIRCDCGQHWEAVGTDWGMQWDPYSRGVLKWKKVSR